MNHVEAAGHLGVVYSDIFRSGSGAVPFSFLLTIPPYNPKCYALLVAGRIRWPGDIPPNVALVVALQHVPQHQHALGTVEAWHNVAGSPSFEKASTSKHCEI